VLAVAERDLNEGLRLFARSDRLGAFDAVLAATARGVNATAIVSADRAFADADVVHVVPDADGVAGLLHG
jgi:predicted nucleic acid-binding protein